MRLGLLGDIDELEALDGTVRGGERAYSSSRR